MKAIIYFAALASVFVGGYARASDQNDELICETPLGIVVPTADAAREIYEAILQGRGDRRDPRADVLVNDDGDFWTVFQSYEGRGGGRLDLRINKYDGTVRGNYSR